MELIRFQPVSDCCDWVGILDGFFSAELRNGSVSILSSYRLESMFELLAML